MCRSMLPILMLTTVALSASDVLPILSDRNTVRGFNTDDQSDDNIYLNSYPDSDLSNNIFYNNIAQRDNYVSLPNFKEITRVMSNDNTNGDVGDIDGRYEKEDVYDDKGYRKEQWHNYPRQLDRLQNSKYTRDEKTEAEDAEMKEPKPSFSKPINDNFLDYSTNEFRVESTDGDRNVYENVVAATNPFLVLKVQLTYLRDDANRDDLNQYPDLYPLQSKKDQGRNVLDNNYYMDDIESTANLVKVKREEPTNNEIANEGSFISDIGSSSGKKKAVKKRLFSLWSRLQSLSHRGHELHHRRHLHAFYGLPDNKGNGIVTAQTRATFIRPPGSPLRWG